MRTKAQMIQDLPGKLKAFKPRKPDDTGLPKRGVNIEDKGRDPSNLGKLQLVTPDYPVGNGHGPEVGFGKAANKAFPALSPGMASIYDNDAYQASGAITRKPIYYAPGGPDKQTMPPWTGRAPALPFVGTSAFNLARGMRQFADTAELPSWLKRTNFNTASAGGLVGGGLGAGSAALMNWLNPREYQDPARTAMLTAALGAILGAIRK